MSAYVRIRKPEELRRCILAAGQQRDIAAAADLSTTRLNQIATGRKQVLDVGKARRLEQVLGVPHGTLFVAVDGEALAPYIDEMGDTEHVEDEPEDAPGSDVSAQPAA